MPIINNNDNISITKLLAYIWLIGVLLVSIYYIYIYLNLMKNIKNFTYDVNDNEIVNIYTELIYRLKINRKICFKYCEGINSPFGTGILKPYIVIPKHAYNSTEIKLILNHELLHFKKHDLLYKIGLISVKILHWFNPLVYVMCKFINYDCELACDESLLKELGIEERKLYAMTFVNSLRFNKSHTFKNNIIIGFNNINNKNILKRRVENMFNLKPRKKSVLVVALSVGILTSSLLSINVFAGKNINKPGIKASVTENLKDITIVSVDTDGNPSKIKSTKLISEEETLALLNKNGGKNIKIASNEKKVNLKMYTYENAPEDVKTEYETNCKAANIKPSSSDEILVPIK